MELSNRTLAVLLVAAIVISIGTSFMSLQKLSDINKLFGVTTGYVATSSHQANLSLTVTSQTSITLTNGTIAWGAGYVYSGCNNCTMATNGTTNAICCLSGWATTIDYGMLIENTGNTNVSLQMNITKNETNFIGGTAVSPYFGFKVITGSSSSHAYKGTGDEADSANSCGDAGGWNFTTWTEVDNSKNTTPFYLCGYSTPAYTFGAENTKDEVEIQIKLIIPQNAPATAKTNQLNLLATSA